MIAVACLVAFVGFTLMTLGILRWTNPSPDHKKKWAAPVVTAVGCLLIIASGFIIFFAEHSTAWAAIVPGIAFGANIIATKILPFVAAKLADPRHLGG